MAKRSGSAGDFYQVLGVGRQATPEEIQRAYRKLARRWHPDVNHAPEASSRFQEISEAYHVLSDPEQRRRYDALGPDFRQAAPPGADGAARGPSRSSHFGVEDAVSWEELLSHLGGLGSDADFAGFRTSVAADQEAALTLTVEEAFAGGRRTITLGGPSGRRQLTVTIPAGVVDGQRLRLAGEGQAAPDGGRAGDLYLVIQLQPSPLYQVSGRDVTMPVWVSPWEAALGAQFSVPALGGPVSVTLPAGTSTGTKLRLAGRGFPNPKGSPGDLYLEVRIEVPRTLSPEERRAFEQLKKVSRFHPRGRE